MSETLSISLSETEQFLQEKYGAGIADVNQIGEGGWSLAFAFVHAGFGFWNKDGKGSQNSWKAFLLDDKNESSYTLKLLG